MSDDPVNGRQLAMLRHAHGPEGMTMPADDADLRGLINRCLVVGYRIGHPVPGNGWPPTLYRPTSAGLCLLLVQTDG